MQHSRRDLLLTAGTGLVAGLLTARMGKALAGYAGDTKLRYRKNVVSPDAVPDLASLKVGVGKMKELATSNPQDPRGWIQQAFIHGDCSGFTHCQHGNWFFPPWHRSYLYYFEDLIRYYSGDENFALPYWDWSRTHGVPASFYGSGNPLDDTVSIRSSCSYAPTAGRGRSVTDQFSQADLDRYVGTSVINDIQKNPDYATYGGAQSGTGALERTPHNFVHRWVGGAKQSNMVQYFSPLDPIFWLHHCNIDRLYSNWLARPGHQPPQDAAWQEQSFNDFYDRNGNPAGSAFTCGMTVDSTVMGYTYDSVLDLPQALMTTRRTLGASPQIVESIEAGTRKLDGRVLSFAAAAPQRSTRQMMNAAAAGFGNFVVRLRLEGIKTPKNQDTAVQVFLGSGITPDTPITAAGYVASFTFFDGQGGGDKEGHHHGSATVLLDATQALQDLQGDISLGDAQSLVVSLVTRPLFAEGRNHAAVEEIQPDKIHFDLVDLKQ